MAYTTFTNPDGTPCQVLTRNNSRPINRCFCCGDRVESGQPMARIQQMDRAGRFHWVHEQCAEKYIGKLGYGNEYIGKWTDGGADGTGGEDGKDVGSEALPKPGKALPKLPPAFGVIQPGKALPKLPPAFGGIQPDEALPKPGKDDGPAQPLTNEQKVEALKDIIDGKLPGQDRMERMQDQIERLTDMLSGQMEAIEGIEKPAPREVKIILPDGKVEIDEAHHPKMPEIIEMLTLDIPVLLVGPTGSGKTHTAMQIAGVMFGPDAKKFGLTPRESARERFGFTSCSMGMSESAILGRLIPTGEGGSMQYAYSEFIRIFENGGLYLWDEMDASDPNVILAMNSALANGIVSVYNRPEKPYAEKHPEFRCIAAANTWGKSASREYVGRSVLDASTLDRFLMGTIDFDYDASLEKQLCPDADLYDLLQLMRKVIMEHRLERVVSTRFFSIAYKVWLAGWSQKRIVSRLVSGWRPDELSKVKAVTRKATTKKGGR